jgi:Tat protein translocase TatB subunit
MGPLELIVILGLALVVLGPDKLPDIARQVARTVAQIRKISSEVTGDLQRSLQIDDPPRTPNGTATNGTTPSGFSQPAPFTPPAAVPPPGSGASPGAVPAPGAAPTPEPAVKRRSATDDDALLPPY